LGFGTTTHLDTGDSANRQWPVRWSRISGGCSHGIVEIPAKRKLRKCILE